MFWLWALRILLLNPKDPCAQIVYTLALKYLYRDYMKAKAYTIWAHGPLGLRPKR